jgi:predicted Zn-ribbon and HTH transcriptional regulator
MKNIDLAPPEAEACLIRSRVASYKGGTLIDETVVDLAEHLRRMVDVGGYRPARCARCGHTHLHMHDRIERRPRGEAGLPVVVVARYICAECKATWRILPAFLARHLWRVWPTVERVVLPEDTPVPREAPPIPERTERRWRGRMVQAALVVVTLLAASNVTTLEPIARAVGLEATRAELVATHAKQTKAVPGRRLAPLAATTHMLERGIRLM